MISVISSCGPVNFLTRARWVPRKYTVNYNYDNVKSERSDLNRRVWVVYSDREGNVTTMRPGGELPFKELEYMEPLYVIGRRGNYYKLIKYNPAVIENERLKNHKEAEYYGWIHKDLLLLFNNSETEVRNGIKLKSLAAITDCEVALDAEKYFNADSLTLYSGPKLEEVCGSVPVSSIIYAMKDAEDGSRVLISQKTGLSPDKMEGLSIGWVDASLVAPFGQRLVLSRPPLEEILVYEPDTMVLHHRTASPVSLSPALYAHRADTSLVFRTLDASDILDHSDNRIYNVDGGPITWRQGQQIATELKDINVIFAFIQSENVIAQMPMLSNAIQNLQPIFERPLGAFNYNYAAIIGEERIDFSSDYLSFSDRLIELGQGIDTIKRADFVATLRNGMDMASRNPTATNVMVLVGEKAQYRDSIPPCLHDDFVRYNGRLLSYQVYTDNEDIYNNFVLRSLDVIETYAERYRSLKRKIIVYADQLRPENLFLEGAKNAYTLDFPAQSMTQGIVIFPEKGKYTDPELFVSGVDSLIRQVELDNTILATSIDRAFAQVGRHRSHFHVDVAEHLGIDPQTKIAPHIGKAFDKISPKWVDVTNRIDVPIDSVNMSTIGLLLTETELKDLKAWMEGLTSMKPDIKSEMGADNHKKTRHVRQVRRELRGIPADMMEDRPGEYGDTAGDSVVIKYAPTGVIRRHLQRMYRQALHKCVFEGRPRHMTLAQAQEYITTMPTISPELNTVTIKNLRRKKRFTNHELELLIEYFEIHKGLVESDAIPVGELTIPNGEKFFFLPSEAMP
jgi:hypothetical protein